MNSVKERELPSRLVGYLFSAAGFLLALVAFYPGYMSEDSISQLVQGRNWQFDDWHPPVMAAVWGLIDKIIPGPFGMLLLHNALYWGAAALFWRVKKRKSPLLGLALVFFGFMPQVLALLSTIWKDVGLGTSLFLASALLYTSTQTGSRIVLCATGPLLFYGLAIRHNAAIAVLPLALWAGFITCRVFPVIRAKIRSFRVLPVALGLVYFGLLWAATIAAAKILVSSDSYAVQQVWLHDLAAISKAKGEPVFPDYVIKDEKFSLEKVISNYNPVISTGITPAAGLKLSNRPEHISALRTKWWHAILDNKVAYLVHRWNAFEQVIAFKTVNVCFPYQSESAPSPFGYKDNDWTVQKYIKPYFSYWKNSLLFRGYLWLLISLGLLYFSLRGRLRGDLEFVFVLALSGFLYGAGYFFYAPSCDFRFLWWTVIASVVALLFFTPCAISQFRTSPRATKEGCLPSL